jgi:hypothetical protein
MFGLSRRHNSNTGSWFGQDSVEQVVTGRTVLYTIGHSTLNALGTLILHDHCSVALFCACGDPHTLSYVHTETK